MEIQELPDIRLNIEDYYEYQDIELLDYVWWKSPVCVTPEAQVPLTLESKFRMTPIKS